jgi:protein-tyrosine phosphatase/membrane-associated phospholipid phosphatase
VDRRLGNVQRLAGPARLSPAPAPPFPAVGGERRPWRRAIAWLLLLGPFFFASYGFATWVSSQRSDIGFIRFDWEERIPLLPWTIVPYWLIDLLYGLSLLLCRTRRELDTHAWRLLATQLIAVGCFLVFPLRCTFERGEVTGAFGWLFDLLASFDQPYNQAPSLHIALLVVLLAPYLRVVPRRWHFAVHGVALLIGISVLTTWQHHFFDIPTGLWLGCLAIWLFPDAGSSPLCRVRLSSDRRRRSLSLAYAAAALAFGSLAALAGGGWLWLLWPAGSLTVVSLIHLLLDGEAFGKRDDGSMPVAVRCLLGPYQFAAWLNRVWWTRRLAPADVVIPGVLLGRLPAAADLQRLPIAAIVDVCAELPCPTPGVAHSSVPMLDLLWPDDRQIERALAALQQALATGPVLVCCALGLARSALVVAAWLLRSGRTTTAGEAVALVRSARPAVALGAREVAALADWQRRQPPVPRRDR